MGSRRSMPSRAKGKSIDEVKLIIDQLPDNASVKVRQQWYKALRLLSSGECIDESYIDDGACSRDIRKAKKLKERSIGKGYDFDLTTTDVAALRATKHCFYTGAEMTLTESGVTGSFSIDRVDGKKGYIKSNVVASSKTANSLKEHIFECDNSKMRMTETELLRFAQSMYEIRYGKSSIGKRLKMCWKLLTGAKWMV